MKEDLLKAELCQLLNEVGLGDLKYDSVFDKIWVALLGFEVGEMDRQLMGLGFEEIDPDKEGANFTEYMKTEKVKSLLRKDFICKILLKAMQREINSLKQQNPTPIPA